MRSLLPPAVLLLLLTTTSHADIVRRHVVETDPARVVVHVHPDHAVTVAFKARIVRLHIPPVRGLTVRQEAGMLVINPARHRDSWGSFHVLTVAGSVLLDIRGADVADIHPAIVIEPAGADAMFRKAVKAEAHKLTAAATRHLRDQIAVLTATLVNQEERIKTAALRFEATQKGQLSDLLTGPVIGPVRKGAADGLQLKHVDWIALGSRRFYVFELLNYGDLPYWVGAFQLFDQYEQRDHAGMAVIGPRDENPPAGVLAIVPPQMWLRGIVEILDPERIGEFGVYAVTSANGRPPLRRKGGGLDLTPFFEEAPDPEIGAVTVSLKGTYGAIWLGDGAGLDRSQATSLKGLGVGVSYGVSRLLALEAEIMGAMTGDARFADVPYNGTTGTLERSATLGRVQGGAMVRIGEGSYQVVGRAGVGLQGASHSGQMVTGTGEAPEPGSFEWSTLFTFGAGLDLRLGALRAGISLSVVNPWGDLGDGLARAAIEAGAHVGLSWN